MKRSSSKVSSSFPNYTEYSWKNDYDLCFIIDVVEREYKVTCTVPLKGLKNWTFKWGKNTKIINTGSFNDALAELLVPFDEERNNFLIQYGDETPISPLNDNSQYNEDGELIVTVDSSVDIDETIDGISQIPKKEFEKYAELMRKDIDLACKSYGKHFGIVTLPTGTHIVRFAIDVGFLSEWNAKALCLDPYKRIIIELEFDYNYLDSLTVFDLVLIPRNPS